MMSSPSLKRLILPAMLGNILEWFEFALYGYFAPIFAQLFFPHSSGLLSLLQIFAIFAAGFLIRPLGGIIFGHLGDKFGRQKTLTASIILMAIPTTCIGLLPTYATAGILSSFLLLACRLLQGMAIGGEMQGITIYVMEHVTPSQRGLQGSWIKFGIFLGILLGSSTALLLGHFLSPAALTQWGWRIPFLAGIPLGLLGYILRCRLNETPHFKTLLSQGKVVKYPLYHTLKYHWRVTVIALFLPVLIEISFYLAFIFIPAYTQKIINLSFEKMMLANTLCMIMALTLLPIMGWISDRSGRKPVLIIATISLILFAYPLFYLLNHTNSLEMILFVQTSIVVLIIPFAAIMPALFAEMFPTEIRYTASSLASNIAASLFGGTAPLVATFLISISGNPNSPGWYLIGAGLVTLLTVITMRETYKNSL